MAMCNLMKYFFFAIVSSCSILANRASLGNVIQPRVTIPQGTLEGKILRTIHGRNIDTFLGIPYAEPPTGNLRFANPVAANGWSGTRNATVDANMCLQYMNGVVYGDEDCLYLNVYIPQSSNASLLPVMVFIHGGRFLGWSSVSTLFGPEYLLDGEVLLVTLNYRLGPLGFLSTGDEAASGNWGLKDQILALKWVQNNIKHFGGDPGQVTLFGQSAGAKAVHLLTLTNETNGLFHRYITHSGSALAPSVVQPRREYASRAFKLGKHVGCFNDTSDSLINCLRTVSSSDIVATLPHFLIWASFPSIIWSPTIELDIAGAVLTDSPENLFAKGQIRDLPWICGIVRDEGLVSTTAMWKNETMFDELLENFDYLLPYILSYTYQSDGGAAWVNAIKSYYFNNDLTADKRSLLANFTMVAGDSQYAYPAHSGLQQQNAIAKNPQYFYVFEYRGVLSSTDDITHSDNYGICHSDDIIYLFPMSDMLASLNKTMSTADLEMIDTMVNLWTSFAISGTPKVSSQNDNIVWKEYSTADNYFRIGSGSDPTLKVQYPFFHERMQFWDSLHHTTKISTDDLESA